MAKADTRLAEFAATLTALQPQPSRIDRDRVMFLAGRASRSGSWLWPMTSAAAILLAGFLAGTHYLGSIDRSLQDLAVQPQTPAVVESTTGGTIRLPRGRYFELRERLLVRDREVWPRRSHVGGNVSGELTWRVGSRVAIDQLLESS